MPDEDEVVTGEDGATVPYSEDADEFMKGALADGSQTIPGKSVAPVVETIPEEEEVDPDSEGDTDDDTQTDEGQPSSPRGDDDPRVIEAEQRGYRKAFESMFEKMGKPQATAPEPEPEDEIDLLCKVTDREMNARYQELVEASRFSEAEAFVGDVRAARKVSVERVKRRDAEARISRLEEQHVKSQGDNLKMALTAAAGSKEKWEAVSEEIGELITIDRIRESNGMEPRFGLDAKKLYRAACGLRAGVTGEALAPKANQKQKSALSRLPGNSSARPSAGGKKRIMSHQESLANEMAADFAGDLV